LNRVPHHKKKKVEAVKVVSFNILFIIYLLFYFSYSGDYHMYMSTENCGNHGEFLAALYKNIVTIS
jgi:hypothetical protein